MAIAFVASTQKALGGGGGTTSAIDTTGATLIVVGVSSQGAGTVTDSKGNTYTALTARSTAGTRHQLFYSLFPTVGAGHTISTNASFSAIVVFAFSGATTYDAQQNGTSGTASPLNTGSVTPTRDNSLSFTGFSASGISITLSTPVGYVGGTVVPGVGATNMYACGAYLLQGTAAATNPAWTWTGSTGDAAASVAVFTDAPPAPVPGMKYFMNGGVDSNWSSDTNWSGNSSLGPNNVTKPIATDTVILNATSPNCTVDTPATCKTFTCTGYVNTLTMNATLTTAGNVVLASGMTIVGTADLILTANPSSYASNGKVWPGGIQLQGANGYEFFLGTCTITGALKVLTPGGTGAYLQGSTVTAGGLTMTGNVGTTSASSVTLTGGTWSGAGIFHNYLTLAGNITISGSVGFGADTFVSNATLTYSSGTITTTGSTVNFYSQGSGGGCTVNAGSIVFNHVTFSVSTSAYTLTTGLTCTGTMTCTTQCQFSSTFPVTCGNLSISGSGSVYTFNTGPVTVTGAILATNSPTLAGTATITAATCAIPQQVTLTTTTAVILTGPLTTTGPAAVLNVNGPAFTAAGLDMSAAPLGTGGLIGLGLAGNGKIVLTGGSLATNTQDYIQINLEIAGNVTLVGNVLYKSNTITQTSGTLLGTGTLVAGSGVTLVVASAWPNLKILGPTLKLGTSLVVTGVLTLPDANLTFLAGV